MSAYIDGKEVACVLTSYVIEDVSTAQGMADRLTAANIGTMYHYTGTTTADYVNGRYYLVRGGGNVEVDLTAIGSYKVWSASEVRPSDYDASIHGGVYQSENYHEHNSNAVCKVKVSGITSLTVYINSYAEGSYDYTIASKLDASSIPTAFNSAYAQINTKSFQRDPTGSLASNYVAYTYTIPDTNEHFFYVVYHKDSSTHSNNDRGYFSYVIPEGVTVEYKEYLSPVGNQVITDTSSYDVKDKDTAQVVDANLIPGNIKEGVTVLGVLGTHSGGGGGGGDYDVYFRSKGQDDYGYCRINDSNDYDFKCIDYSSGNSMMLPKSGVSKIKFYGFSHSGTYPVSGYSWVRWRPHAADWLTWTGDNGQDMIIGTEYTLTGDIDILASYATCLTGDTLITMADGTTKRLDHVYVGDMVMGCNGPVKVTYCDSDCDKWHNVYDVWTFDDGTVIKTIHPHRFYNVDRKAFVYMAEWNIGDHALSIDGREVALVKHETVNDDIRHYTIFTSDSNTYYANSFLSGNRNSVIQ